MNPKVSVIIKSFNHEKYISEAINSILSQSFQDFEIVVTDDASTDKSTDIIRSFKDPRINFVSLKQNQGISLTMNATLNRARGEFIAILNSDDVALPDRLERQVHYLNANSRVTAVFSLPILIDEEGASIQSSHDFQSAIELADAPCSTWLRKFFFQGNCLCAPTAMIRRSAIIENGGYDPRLGSLNDFDYWIRMLTKGHVFNILQEPVTLFRIRSHLQNASSPTFFNLTRSAFEHSKVLNQFRALSREMILDIFQADIKSHNISTGLNSDQLLVELALRSNSIPNYLFGLNTLFETANSTEECARLRNVAGSLDIFRIVKIAKQNEELAALKAKIGK
jgi:glycosyltransferase involved in cell wall biosynthesis